MYVVCTSVCMYCVLQCVCMYVRQYVGMYVCINVLLYVCMYVCMYVCTYFRLYAGMYVRLYVCMCVCPMYVCKYYVGMYVVGIATCYVLDGPGIENRRGRDFRQPSRPAVGPNIVLYSGYRVYFPAVKRPGRGVDHSPQSSTKVKERVEIYLNLPLGLLDLFQGEL